MDSHAHAQAYEADRTRMERVIVIPSSFFAAIKGVRVSQGLTPTSRDTFRKAHTLVAAYDDVIWSSDVILIPGKLHAGHWILFVICNPGLARSKANVQPPCQIIERGELRPDINKFSILSLSAWGETPERLRQLMALFLQFHYELTHGTDLQYVEGWNATVSHLRSPALSTPALTRISVSVSHG